MAGSVLPQWFTHLWQDIFGPSNPQSYTDPADTDEDEEGEETQYRTIVVYGTPLRETKCLFVNEMNDMYTEEELNTPYHSADEYRKSLDKFGYIYKSQKFENADTTQKLLDYAKDWVKNNYHGSLTSFTITAVDMRELEEEAPKYRVGDQIAVVYPDPFTHEEVKQTLSCITAEYDLANPEKNQYKIGVPDLALNKVYGETAKSGGGGGGGKPSDETDDDTNTEVSQLGDNADETNRGITEIDWAHFAKRLREGDLEGAFGDLLTPGAANPTGAFNYFLTSDGLKSTQLAAAQAQINTLKVNNLSIKGQSLDDYIEGLLE